MPRTLILLLVAVLSAGRAATAREQSGVRTPLAPAAREGEVKPRLSVDADTLEAEQSCARGEALAAAGGAEASAAREAYGRALKLYLAVFNRERPPASAGRTPSRELMRERLKRAPQCIEGYLRLGGGGSAFERSQLEAFRGQALLFAETDEARMAFLGSELDERARIIYKPEPNFPEAARGMVSRGSVRLRAVLDADGTVKHIFVLKGTPYGFPELCVDAARGIKFTPAVRNGRPVSQFITLEYHFHTY